MAQGLNTGGEDYLLGLTDRSRRITLVDQDGTVRYDNTADAGQMENHLEREEIQEALSTGSGQSRRVSETLSQETFYYAILLENGMVLRLAATQSSVWALLLTVLQPAAMVVIAALVLGAISGPSGRQGHRGAHQQPGPGPARGRQKPMRSSRRC